MLFSANCGHEDETIAARHRRSNGSHEKAPATRRKYNYHSTLSVTNSYHLKQNREAIKVEKARLKRLRKLHGIYPSISMLNLFQLPLHMTYISLINKLAYNYNLSPAMVTEGFLWFRDLSSPDPYSVLPILGGALNMLNMLNTTTTNANPMMRKMRRYIVIMPLISIPI